MKNEIDLKEEMLYNCSIETKGIFEESSIIPLAKDTKSDRQFYLIFARKFIKQYPEHVKDIMKMTFIEIWNDGVKNLYPYDHELDALTVILRKEHDGSLVDNDSHIFGFVATDINLK